MFKYTWTDLGVNSCLSHDLKYSALVIWSAFTELSFLVLNSPPGPHSLQINMEKSRINILQIYSSGYLWQNFHFWAKHVFNIAIVITPVSVNFGMMVFWKIPGS